MIPTLKWTVSNYLRNKYVGPKLECWELLKPFPINFSQGHTTSSNSIINKFWFYLILYSVISYVLCYFTLFILFYLNLLNFIEFSLHHDALIYWYLLKYKYDNFISSFHVLLLLTRKYYIKALWSDVSQSKA